MTRFDGKAFVKLLGLALIVWFAAATLSMLGGSTGRFGSVTMPIALERLNTYVLPASIIGAALAAAGVAYQAVLRNPLADPYLLGVSSGATLAAYVWRLPLAAAVPWIAGTSPHVFALAGAVLAVATVLGVSRRAGRIEPTTAVLAGVIVNALCGSLFMLLNAIFRDPPGSGGMLTFLVGDIQTAAARRDVWLSTAMMASGIVTLWPLTTSLNAVRLSEDEAASLGVNVHRARWLALGIASLITAAAVAISGPIGFVGLVCPHIARFFVGNDNRRLLIVSVAFGASMLSLANLLERMLAGSSVGTMVPVGVITSMVGAPFFLALLLKGRR